MPVMPEGVRNTRGAATRYYLGFDYGRRRIGVAVGQPLTATATPLLVMDRTRKPPDWDRIGWLIAEWHPVGFVVGIPYPGHAREHELSRAAARFGRQLGARFHRPVFTIDERLSSWTARSITVGGGRPVDDRAAAVILETWLSEQETADA